MLPDFLGIGAARCGTTTVHHFLDMHSGAFVPRQKELHFFSMGRIGSPHCRIASLEEYSAQFAGSADTMVRGEISPSYLWVPGTAEAIKKQLPHVKLLVMLRDPVERAVSDFQYSWKNGLNRRPFAEFIDEGLKALEAGRLEALPFHPSAVLWKGLYAQQLQDYTRLFPRQSLGVFLLKDLRRSPDETAVNLCTFLGLRATDLPQLGHTNARPNHQPVDEATRARLREFYRPSIRVLSDLLDRPMGEWLNPTSIPEEAA